MNQDNILHFEDLWTSAEGLSQSIHRSTSNIEMFDKIRNIFTGINEIDSSNITHDAKTEMKRRFIGEVLFLLSAISAKENIDVYGALKDQLLTNALLIKSR